MDAVKRVAEVGKFMTEYVFYFKEALFNPSTFFEHQNDDPNIIDVHWILIPGITFIVLALVHWASTTITLNQLELDFEGLLLVHIDHLVFGIGLSLLIWFRTWITLKYVGQVKDRTSEVTAWCNAPYMVILFILLCSFSIYFPIFGDAENAPAYPWPSITSVRHGMGILRIGIFISDIWCIILMYNAVSVINQLRVRKVLFGAVIIFYLPPVIFSII